MTGALMLFGGSEWSEVTATDEEIARRCDGSLVVVPTAAAFELPGDKVATATAFYRDLGVTVEAVPLLTRAESSSEEVLTTLSRADAIYFTSGSPMHLRSVLLGSAAWDTIVDRWRDGALLVASGESAAALGEVMVDPRGGAFTLGLGLFDALAVCGRLSTWSDDQLHRTVSLAPPGLWVVGIAEGSAVMWDGGWSRLGNGRVECFSSGVTKELVELPPLHAR